MLKPLMHGFLFSCVKSYNVVFRVVANINKSNFFSSLGSPNRNRSSMHYRQKKLFIWNNTNINNVFQMLYFSLVFLVSEIILNKSRNTENTYVWSFRNELLTFLFNTIAYMISLILNAVFKAGFGLLLARLVHQKTEK
jgi:hypothetical protein